MNQDTHRAGTRLGRRIFNMLHPEVEQYCTILGCNKDTIVLIPYNASMDDLSPHEALSFMIGRVDTRGKLVCLNIGSVHPARALAPHRIVFSRGVLGTYLLSPADEAGDPQ